METFLIRTLQLILSLAILILLHEFGHFLFARLFKVRVDKFYMFFNPKYSLVRAKRIDRKWQIKFFEPNVPPNERMKLDEDGNPIMNGKHHVMEPVPESELPADDWRRFPDHTEWGIGWLPLGGYCKIAGMIDESMDKTQMAQPPQHWEYRSRPVWQRLPIIIGGVLVNFILAMIIYSAVLFTWGKEYIPLENATYGLSFSKTMQNIGFKNGDKILTVDGITPETYQEVGKKIIYDNAKIITLQRGDSIVTIHIPHNFEKDILKSETSPISLQYPFVIDNVAGNSIAEKARFQSGDSIVAINGKPMGMFQDISQELDASKNKKIRIDFVRNNATPQSVEVQLDEKGKLGVGLRSPLNYFETKKEMYGFFQSIPAGISMGVETLSDYVKGMKFVFTKEGASSLGGFGSIGKLFPPVWDWQTFWLMTAFLSVILAFMNFLPIPGLDGGYVLFLLYEMVTGKKPSEKFMENAVTVGFVLLMTLLIYANGNDIVKALFK
ncbi:MAG: RIP metalloprotease RseP [Paludibacteraceae bacterium]